MTTPLVPVESGTAVQVCSYGPGSGTSHCEQRAPYLILLRDPRMDAKVSSLRCALHLGRGWAEVLQRFPDATLEVTQIPGVPA